MSYEYRILTCGHRQPVKLDSSSCWCAQCNTLRVVAPVDLKIAAR